LFDDAFARVGSTSSGLRSRDSDGVDAECTVGRARTYMADPPAACAGSRPPASGDSE
jgi:hypothetical protein